MSNLADVYQALAYWGHMGRLFMALYASSPADNSHVRYRDSAFRPMRRVALAARARAVVIFDRVLADPEERWE